MSKVLVAIDPFTKADGNAKRALQTIRAFANRLESKLQSVAVVSPDQLMLPLDFEKNLAEEFLQAALDNLEEKQKKLAVHFDDEPEVAVQPYRSQKRSIEAVTNIADELGADFLAVLTHVKKRRTFNLFGFVESLLSVSRTPVLAVSTECPLVTKINRLIFASDFSLQCKQAFIDTLDLAKTMGAKIIVVHKAVEFEGYAALASGMISPLIQAYEPLLEAEQQKTQRSVNEWTRLAALQSVEAEFVISRRSGMTGDIILQTAKAKKAQLIVVVSQTGKYESLVLGSVTRRLLQKAKVPVLVMRANSLGKGKKNSLVNSRKEVVHEEIRS